MSGLSGVTGLCLDGAGRPVDAVAAPVLTGVLEAALALYDELPIPGPCSVGLVAGSMAAVDRGLDCAGGCAGQLWVRLEALHPTLEFPAPHGGAVRGPLSWAVVVEVGLVRPAPMIRGDGPTLALPSMAEETDAADTALLDAAVLREALVVRYAQALDVGIALGSWTPFGPSGGIVGGTWTATLEVP